LNRKGKIREKIVTIIMSFIEMKQSEIAVEENKFKEYKIFL